MFSTMIAATALAAATVGLVAPTPTQPAHGSAVASTQRNVPYLGLRISVPADWPVIDTASHPARCARVDHSALYLGPSGPDQRCPAHLNGIATTMQIEPVAQHSTVP